MSPLLQGIVVGDQPDLITQLMWQKRGRVIGSLWKVRVPAAAVCMKEGGKGKFM